MKAALLQLNPCLGQVSRNIERATSLVANALGRGLVDLLVLPELAFTGYKFLSREKIEPYLEVKDVGVTSVWARETSVRYQCFTVVGYPEISSKDSAIYNSVVMTSPQGQVVCNYRKSHLYTADEQWGCSESSRGFFSAGNFRFGDHLHQTQIGVCMDLNPYKFQAPFEAYEFATSVVANGVSLVVCPMAWLHSRSPNLAEPPQTRAQVDVPGAFAQDEHDFSTIAYWAMRMDPFWSSDSPVKILVACNRSGWEDDVMYAGSSSIIVCRGQQRPVLLGSLGQAAEGLLIREIDGS